MTPSDSHSLCSSAGVPSLRRVAGAPPALVSLPARIMSLDASSSVPGARSSTSRSRRRATRMPHRRLAEASMSSPSAPSAWLVRCEPAQYLRRASTSHHCRPFIALVSHTACAAPTRPLRDPGTAATSPSSCFTASPSGRPPSSRGEHPLHVSNIVLPCLTFLFN